MGRPQETRLKPLSPSPSPPPQSSSSPPASPESPPLRYLSSHFQHCRSNVGSSQHDCIARPIALMGVPRGGIRTRVVVRKGTQVCKQIGHRAPLPTQLLALTRLHCKLTPLEAASLAAAALRTGTHDGDNTLKRLARIATATRRLRRGKRVVDTRNASRNLVIDRSSLRGPREAGAWGHIAHKRYLLTTALVVSAQSFNMKPLSLNLKQ